MDLIPEIKIEEVTSRTVIVTGGHGNAGGNSSCSNS